MAAALETFVLKRIALTLISMPVHALESYPTIGKREMQHDHVPGRGNRGNRTV